MYNKIFSFEIQNRGAKCWKKSLFSLLLGKKKTRSIGIFQFNIFSCSNIYIQTWFSGTRKYLVFEKRTWLYDVNDHWILIKKVWHISASDKCPRNDKLVNRSVKTTLNFKMFIVKRLWQIKHFVKLSDIKFKKRKDLSCFTIIITWSSVDSFLGQLNFDQPPHPLTSPSIKSLS